MGSKARFIILVVIVAMCSFTHAADDEAAWRDYKFKFGKIYKTRAEEQLRKRLFLDNKHYVDSQTTKETKASFKQEVNFLSDLSTEEVNEMLNGFRIDEEVERHHNSASDLLETLFNSLNETLGQQLMQAISDRPDTIAANGEVKPRAWYEELLSPSSLDWRRYGRVSRVKSQGSCGSCWAFAAVGALEGMMASRNTSILLSEQNLVDCSRRQGNHGCQGGMVDSAYDYVRDEGIMSAKAYPYTAKNEPCKFVKSKSIMSLRGSARLPRGNEGFLRVALSSFGPIPIAIDASSRSLHSYSSGVYNDPVCKNRVSQMNHAVLLVGYGTDKSSGADFWLVKNSWGLDWGEKGYIRIARGQNNLCGVATYAVLPYA